MMLSLRDLFSVPLEKSAGEILKDKADDLAEMSEEEMFSFAGYSREKAERAGLGDYSYLRSTMRIFLKNRGALLALAAMLAILLFALIQPFLPNQFDPNAVNMNELYIADRNVKPNAIYWFGTNSIGQDLWARIWAGTRTSLLIGFTVAFVEAAVGIAMGVCWGYVRRLDFLFTELYNVADNIPPTVLLILFSMMMKPSVKTLIFAMCITGWMGTARFIRNQVLIIRDRDYNVASRCLGTPLPRLIMKNLLPYLVSVVMLRMALAIPGAISSEVFVTYIGLGLPSSTPSLGTLINEGRAVMMNGAQRYQLIFPVAILSVVTISFYIIGNAISDAADPKNHR